MDESVGFLARLWRRNAPATIAGVVLLTLLTAVAYDFALRPGIGKLGRLVLRLITLGSQTVQDNAYVAAALDPTPKSALFLLMVVMSIATFLVVIPVAFSQGQKQAKMDLDAIRKEVGDDENAFRARLDDSIRKDDLFLKWLLAAFSITLLVLWGLFLVHSQSIMVWRVFHADLARIAPFLTEQQRLMYESRYAGIRTREDYIQIHTEFQRIAQAHKVELREEETW